MRAPVLAIAALVPAVAVAAVWWATSGQTDDSLRAELDDLRQRVAGLERQDQGRATAIRATGRQIAQLEERVVEAELRDAQERLARRAGPAESDEAGGPPEDVRRREEPERGPPQAETAAAARLLAGVDAMTDSLDGLKTRLAGMKLRQLPVEERWQRAMEDVGLNENQVAVLREAFSERDAVYADATEKEKRRDDDGTWLVETRVDTAAVEEADRRHEASLNGVMTAEQRQRWTDLGYAGAFGTPRPSSSTWRYPVKR